MKPAIKKLLGRHSGDGVTRKPAGSPAAESHEGCPLESEPHGLFVLYPSLELSNKPAEVEVDIVAIHGLNGTARKTWLDGTSGKLWLEDFLPESIPKARIMTYGYDSRLAFSRTKAGIENFARDLLNRLRMMRAAHYAKNRPLIFVAHSLGGIVVKKALIIANEAEIYYGSLLKSTVGIVFMGTPHRGSELVPWALLLGNIVHAMFLGQVLRKDLLQELNTRSTTLMDISRAFVHRSAPLRIMSFIETQIERPLPTLVVPEFSARMDLPNEMIFPVNTHHRNICRYPNNSNQTYVLVEAAIKELVSEKSSSLKSVLENITDSTGEPSSISDIASIDPSTSRSGLRRSPRRNYVSTQSVPTTTQARLADRLSSNTSAPDLTSGDDVLHTVWIRVSNLKRKLRLAGKEPRVCSTVLRVSADSLVEDLKNSILKAEPGILKNFEGFKFLGHSYCIHNDWEDVFTTVVEVTAGRSSYSPALGYKINLDQTIASFFSRAFPNPVQVKLQRHFNSSDSCSLPSHTVLLGQRNMQEAQISLLKTLRIPEDGREYELPPTLGSLPIYDGGALRGVLPVSMAAQGGLIVPMHEMEAMRIVFDCQPGKKFAVRPYLGGVNGISGLSLLEDMTALRTSQDYVVLPDQERLDGIAIKPGIVRQFISTPTVSRLRGDEDSEPRGDSLDISLNEALSTSEATVEWQMTGKDTLGGIQLQIIPQYDVKNLHAGNTCNVIPQRSNKGSCDVRCRFISYEYPVPASAMQFDVLKCPKELRLQENEVIHIKDLNYQQTRREKLIKDLFVEVPSTQMSTDFLELEVYTSSTSEVTFNIRIMDSLDQLFSFKFDRDDDFDDIISFIREEYMTPQAILGISFPVTNDPAFHFPVYSWDNIYFVLGLLELREKISIDFILVSSFILNQLLRYLPANSFFHPEWSELPSDWNAQHRRICYVCDESHRNLFGNKQNVVFCMPDDSTASDLCQEIKSITGSSVRLFRRPARVVGSGFFYEINGSEMKDSQCLFYESNLNDNYDVPYFEILNQEPKFKITIRIPTDRIIYVSVRKSTSISNIHRALQDPTGIPPIAQRLIYRGYRVWETIGAHNIGPEEYLELHAEQIGGGPEGEYIFVMTAFGRKITLVLSPGSLPDIAFLKAELLRETGIEPERQILTYKGFELQNDSLASLYIEKILYLAIRHSEPKVLGIGPGGNVIQDIKLDESDPALWDVTNSKILNICLLEATTFGSIMGLVPSASPNNAQSYAEAGLPVKTTAESDVESLALWDEEAFDVLRGVDVSNQRNATRMHGVKSIVDPIAEVEGYTDNGLCIATTQDIITLDVDDTLPGLQN